MYYLNKCAQFIIKWDKNPLEIVLVNKSNIGEDNLKLFFKITKNADLLVNVRTFEFSYLITISNSHLQADEKQAFSRLNYTKKSIC